MYKLLYVFLMLLCLCPEISAQQFPFRHYSTDEGLSGNDIISMHVDKKGYLWIGTYNGLDRFNGMKFTHFSEKNSGFEGKIVNDIAEDESGNIWAGFLGGIAVYSDGQFKNYTEKDGLNGKEVYEILPVKGRIWIASDAGVESFDGNTFKLYPLTLDDWPSYLALYEGRVCVESEHDLYIYDEAKDGFVPANLNISLQALHNHPETKELYLADAGALYLYKDNAVKKTTSAPFGDEIIDFAFDKNITWIYSGSRIWKHSSFADEVFDPAVLDSPSISTLAVDREGNLWIGEWGGLSLMLSSDIYSYKEHLPGKRMTYSSPAKGDFWVSGDHGISRITNQGKLVTRITSPYVNSVLVENGTVIASDINSVKEYYPDGTLKRVLHNGPGNVAYRGKSGLYLGTQSGLYLERAGRFELIADSAAELPSNQIWGIVETGDVLLVGTENGLAVREKGEWKTYDEKNGLGGTEISCIVNDARLGILIGTDKGISSWNNGPSAVFATYSPVYSLCTDPDENIWAGTGAGLMRIRNKKVNLKIDRNKGLQGTIQNVSYFDGYIYAATDKGLSRIKSDIVFLRPIPPMVEIFEAEINSKPARIADLRNPLNHDKKSLAFTFSAIYMFLPSEVKYSFRLLGYQNEWTEPAEYTKSTFTNLSPNNYTFQVRALAEDGKESDIQAVTFSIKKPFWNQWWFILPVLTIAAVLLFFAARYLFHAVLRIRLSELQKEEIIKRNELIEKDLMLARQIQHCLLPRKELKNISFYYNPVDMVGGDLIDIVQFRDSEKIGIFISDVSGHGVAAAFITTMIKSFFVNSARSSSSPSEVLYELNELLYDKTNGNFITSFYGLYSPEDKMLLYSNAGHNPPFLIRKNEIVPITGGKSRPLCIFPNSEIQRKRPFLDSTLIVEKGDKILFYTDGLTEAVHIENGKDFFESILFDKILPENASCSNQALTIKIIEALFEFRGSEKFEDDVCFICLEA